MKRSKNMTYCYYITINYKIENQYRAQKPSKVQIALLITCGNLPTTGSKSSLIFFFEGSSLIS